MMKKPLLISFLILTTILVFVACEHSHPAGDDPKAVPLTIEFYDMGGKVQFTNAPSSLMYSINGGRRQKLGNATIVEVGDDQRISIYATRPTASTDRPFSINCSGSDCYIYGNVMSLVIADGYEKRSVAYANAFNGMFKDNRNLRSHPDYDLLLPATELKEYCYYEMFSGCINLTRVPELPAENLAKSCYERMFNGCTNLESVTELPATELERFCYKEMFKDCVSLTSADIVLGATVLPEQCYYEMFSGCKNIEKGPEIKGEKVGSWGCAFMFYECEKLKETPELLCTELAANCYSYMFRGCKALTKTTKLPATRVEEYCYYGMFSNCTGLKEAPELPAETLARSCYSGMFSGCTNISETPVINAKKVATSSCYEMFLDCKNIVEGPILYAQSLTTDCYEKMFKGCSKLKTLTCLATVIEVDSATQDWVEDVANENGILYVAAGKESGFWPDGDSGLHEGWQTRMYKP